MPNFAVDANGIVTEGRWTGRHVDEVMTYLEGLESVIATPSEPKPEPPKPATPPADNRTPEEKLAAAAGARTSSLEQVTIQRLVADDEAAAEAEFPDYGKYKEKINDLRKNVSVSAVATRGFHRTAYMNIKLQDPEVQKLIASHGQTPPAETPPAETPPAEPPAQPPTPPAPPKPRAAPPAAAPTPGARGTPPPAGPAALVPNDKLKLFCQRTGKNVDEYMKQLQAEGRTQEDIDNMGQLGNRGPGQGRVTLAYDRPVAKRS